MRGCSVSQSVWEGLLSSVAQIVKAWVSLCVTYLDDGEADMRHHLRGVLVQVLPGSVVHYALVELGRLRVLALLAFVRVVALPRHDVVRDLVRRLGSVGPERMLETVGYVRLVPGVVRVAAQGTVEVEALVLPGHEGAVDGDLVQIHADAVVLRVTVEEHAELEERVGRVLDTRDHTAGGKGGLLYITVIVLRVLVEHKPAELVHLR